VVKRVFISLLAYLAMQLYPVSALSDESQFAQSTQFHPKTVTVENVEGVWLSKDEMTILIEAASKKRELEALVATQDRTIKLSQLAVATSSAAVQQYRFAAGQSLDLLTQCKAALTAETDRCESIWRQPTLPLGLGVVAGALMCIGTARAQR
jgi:hypothetical protein